MILFDDDGDGDGDGAVCRGGNDVSHDDSEVVVVVVVPNASFVMVTY